MMCKKYIYFSHLVLVLSIIHGNITYGFDPSKDPNLVGFWKFDEGSGTVAIDSSPRGNNGTFVGTPQWVEGYRKNALYFDGSSAAVEIATPLDLNSNHVTITAWVKRNGEQSTWAAFVFTRGGGSVAGFGHSETIELRYHWNDATWAFSSGLEPPDNEWFFAALVIEPTQGTIYLNEQTAVNAVAHDIEEFGGSLFIGQDPQGGRFFDGTIDEVAIFNRSLTQEEVKMVMIGVSPALAADPIPANEDTDVFRDVVLSWTPGIFADSHNVYLGTNLNDVNEADIGSPLLIGPAQDVNIYDPDRLEFDQIYYWRVDEVNAPPDNTVFKGAVWSFKVEPETYPIPSDSIIATASSQASENEGPEQTINISGLVDSLHSTDTLTMWLSGPGEPASAWIQYEFDKTYKMSEMLVWNYNGDSILSLYGLKEVTVEYSTDATNWTQLTTVTEFAQATGMPGYASNTTVDFNSVAAKYVKITANGNFAGGASLFNQYGLSEVRFTYIPVNARKPNPESGATDVEIETTLSWRPGREAAEHKVYISTDQQAVIDGTAPAVTVNQASYSPPTLALGSVYHWRIDEVNNTETITIWQSNVWNFTTQEYLVVDNFESYNDTPIGQEGSNLVYITWEDGYANPATNGSTMGYPAGVSMETGNVYSGDQSVPLLYDNTTADISEVIANTNDLPIGSNWSIGAPETLVLLISGDPGNNSATNQLYVKVDNTKVLFDGNISRPQWQQWNIDLAALGINLNNVAILAIGLERTGSSGSAGVVFLDEIRLYGAAPAIPKQIWLEAEEADSIEEPMMIFDDPNASAGQYIMKDPNADESTGSPPEDGLVTYTFTVEGGTYKIAGRVITDGNNDSFWVRIPDAVMNVEGDPANPGWIEWNGMTQEDVWGWEDVFSSNNDDVTVEFTLEAGTHTLEIRYREDESQLDALVVTKID